MSLFIPMIFVGLVTSVHCVTMCGTMVLSYAIKGDGGGPFLKRMLPHFAYHTAKIMSYMLVGLLLGAIGSAFNLGGIRGYVTVFAGVFMVLMGLNMTGKFPFLRFMTLRPPKFLTKALMKVRKKASSDSAAGESTLLTPVMFGSLTGLMPCGPLQSAQLAAAGAGSAFAGSIAMLGFGLGTMPLMLGFGAISGILGQKFRDRMMFVASFVIMGVGLVMLNRGAMLVGSPVTASSIQQYVLGGPAPASADAKKFKAGKDGVTEVKLTIKNVQFVPNVVAIPADKKVRLIVDRQEENVCSAQLAVPKLGILQTLKPNGITTIDIPPTKSGLFTLTCQMGMMAGRLQVGEGAASPSRLPQTILLLGGAGAIGWAYRRSKKQQAELEEEAQANNRPIPAPGFMGFSPPEVIVIAGALVTAVVTGLFLGGYFS